MRPEAIGPLLLALIIAGCAAAEIDQEEPQSNVEVAAQMSVKTALLEDANVSAAPMRVVYEEGTVVLQGFVETEEERRRAGEVARRAVPNLEVVNNLLVWKPQGAREG